MGQAIKGIDKIMPKTYDILKNYNSINVAGITVLIGETILDWHSDETGKKNNSLAINLGLISDNSVLTVKDSKNVEQSVSQDEGKIICFDSNYIHKVQNYSKNIRFMLYIDFKTDYIYGVRTKGKGQASKLGYPTVNMILGRDLNCGFYECKFDDNDCVLIVDRTKRFGECHIKKYMKEYDKINNFYVYNLRKIESDEGIVGMYNKACLI